MKLRKMLDVSLALVMSSAVVAPTMAMAQTPRELLMVAAFQTTDKKRALALIQQAITAADKTLAVRPADREANLQRGVAIGYRAKLTRNASDAKTARGIFEALARQNPRDPEAQIVIAGWHLDSIDELGSFMARTALGARTQSGDAALKQAVKLGGERAVYPGIAALMEIRKSPENVAQARQYAEAAAAYPAPTQLDIQMKRAAISILPALRANNGKAAAALARKLLPFGKLSD